MPFKNKTNRSPKVFEVVSSGFFENSLAILYELKTPTIFRHYDASLIFRNIYSRFNRNKSLTS